MWRKYKSFTICIDTGDEFNSTELNQYQVKIIVYNTAGTSTSNTVYLNNACRSDFGDIRFKNELLEDLPYWIETITSTYAVFWVKIDIIQNIKEIDRTCYIYYDNPYAETTSNGDSTFEFFDDFSSPTISTVKWITSNDEDLNTGTFVTLIDDACYVQGSDATSTISSFIQSTQQFASNTSITIRANIESYDEFSWDETYHSWVGYSSASTGIETGTYAPTTSPYHVIEYNGTYGDGHIVHSNVTSPIITNITDYSNVYNTFEISRFPTHTTFYLNNVSVSDHETAASAPIPVTCGVHKASNKITQLDWIFIRKLHEVEPSILTWGTEASIPNFASPTKLYVTPTVMVNTTLHEEITSIEWDFGNNTYSTLTSPSVFYTQPGLYIIKASVTNNYNVTATYAYSVGISEIPIPNFKPSYLNVINATLPYTVQFTNLSSPTEDCNYLWDFGDGATSTDEHPSHSFATIGMYDVELTVTNALGSSTRTYTDAIRLTRKSRTMNEVVGGADTFSTFGCHVFVEYPSGSDLPLVYATILPEGVYFIQREIPDVPGIDEWGVRHLYSTINEWGIKIFNTINSWGHKIMHNASSVDRTPLKCIDVEIFEETVTIADDHQFDEDPS